MWHLLRKSGVAKGQLCENRRARQVCHSRGLVWPLRGQPRKAGGWPRQGVGDLGNLVTKVR
jgi:hypothetical protein